MRAALAIDSEIVLRDEPFGALDEQARLLMGEWLSRRNSSRV
jgi:ABC-type nitrate/sulfonate/bicarbonate transport system ATPase subunit